MMHGSRDRKKVHDELHHGRLPHSTRQIYRRETRVEVRCVALAPVSLETAHRVGGEVLRPYREVLSQQFDYTTA